MGNIWFHFQIYKWDISSPKAIGRSFKHFWHRLTKGFDETDMWELHYHLADLIQPRLKFFIQSKRHGYPKCFNSQDQFTDDEAFELWNKTLGEMLEAFDLLLKIREEEHSLKETVPINLEQAKKDHEKIQHGLKLFGKYFTDLWD